MYKKYRSVLREYQIGTAWEVLLVEAEPQPNFVRGSPDSHFG
jgi:hypothetical protein